MIKKIAFDIDGTLINWEECYFDAILPAFNNNKKEKDLFLEIYDEIETTKPYMTKNLLLNELNKKSKKKYDIDLIDKIVDIWGNCVPEKIEEKYYSTLDYLSKKYELVIISNGYIDIQKNRLIKTDLDKYFSKYYCAEKGLKPNKECYENLIDNCNREEILIIGDNMYLDYLCPIKYGFKAILLDKNNKYDNIDNKINSIEKLKEIL